MIPLPRPSLRVLSLQQRVLQQTSEGQEEDEVADNDAVADAVLGLVLGAVDVAADDAVEVAPANDEAEGDTALVDAFGVVGGPRIGSTDGTTELRRICLPHDGIGDTGIYAQCSEECSGVLDAGRFSAEEHGEADHAEEGGEEVTETTLAGAIGDITDGDGQDSSGSIRRNGEELGGCRFVAELERVGVSSIPPRLSYELLTAEMMEGKKREKA